MYVMTETAFLQVVNASKGGRTAPATRGTCPFTTDAVGESVPAVEETSPAVEESSHGIYVLFHGCLRAWGVEAGEMLAD